MEVLNFFRKIDIEKLNFKLNSILLNKVYILIELFLCLNNLFNLFGSSDNLNKLIRELFFSISSLISQPVLIFKQNKLTIRFFLYLAPKLNRKLRSGLINRRKRFKKHI